MPVVRRNHIYQVLTADQTVADGLITRTADWFAETLANK
jgi:hypothetical protein